MIHGGPESALWRSLDAGKTWTKVAAGFPGFGDLGRIGLNYAPSNTDLVYAQVEAKGPKAGMDFRILGSLEVYDNERPLSLGGHQQRALLALLLLRANQVVPVDEIVEDLWGARPPPSATKSVKTKATAT